jgi:hypothetical protein
LSPTRPVALDIDGKTIHRGFKQAIRDFLHGTDLLVAMQTRYDWPDGILERIDWDTHRQATQTQSARRTHYVKLCHDILPVGKLVCHYGQGLPDYCSLCRTPDEDFHHVLRCVHPSRAKWRSTLLLSLTKLCHSIKTSQTLVDILLQGLRSWFNDVPFHMDDEYSTDHQILIQEQTTIGWSHIFQGRMSLKWAELQQDHYSGMKPKKGQDGQSWTRKILCHIFLHWNTLWDTRNTDLHGKDETARGAARHAQTLRELELLYDLKHSVLHRDRSLFYDSLDEHKLNPTHSIRQWINTNQPTILKSIKDAKKQSLLHVRSLSHYFGAG